MDVAVAVSGYVSKIATAGDGVTSSSAKMKILLLDSETVRRKRIFLFMAPLISHRSL
jgi:vacuolar protein sorting-associated protein 45